jgi:environmental stress-induced protein Ves
MNIGPIDAGWRTFCLDAMTPEPWRNGGGLTRTIATSADHDAIVWRVSVADITHDGPFSVFPGIDRAALLISGQGVSLGEAGLQNRPQNRLKKRLQAGGEAAQFRGEALLQATLDDGPVRLWNVMTRRGQACCTLQLIDNAAVELDGAPWICLVQAGRYHLRLAGTELGQLDAGCGIIVDIAAPHLQLLPAGSEASLICTRIAPAPSSSSLQAGGPG